MEQGKEHIWKVPIRRPYPAAFSANPGYGRVDNRRFFEQPESIWPSGNIHSA